MQDVNAPKSLSEFQLNYGRHLRNPSENTLPLGVNKRRSEIYEDLLFNNIRTFIDTCFPVAKSLFSDQDWQVLARAFFHNWRCTTPIFSQIPYEFVRYISEGDISDSSIKSSQPQWLPELLHYEWVELEVDVFEDDTKLENLKGLILNPSAKLLVYQWPVHTISNDQLPESPLQTCLVVYRNIELSVRFLELNATTFMLLQFLEQHPSGFASDILHKFAKQIQHPDPTALVQFGFTLLAELHDANIIFGEIL